MKNYIVTLFILAFCFNTSNIFAESKKAVVIDHKSVDLLKILNNGYIDKAKDELFIGYGHTSHGSQLITGMNALMLYFTDGKFNWNSTGGKGYLKLVEGGILDLDCGYEGWDDRTRDFLKNNPKCNVIIWSWCGQVNDVDLNSHYLTRMNKLETDYPNVKFVYMTGHLEGEGPNGSLEKANNTIRQFCVKNNKILFDFADIEKYSPDGNVNYDEYFADDGCNYEKPGGESGNWAFEWLEANPDHILTKISDLAEDCAHSVSLNCVMKGIASWHLWARIAGWDGDETSVDSDIESNKAVISPNPASEFIEIKLGIGKEQSGINEIKIYNLFGQCVKVAQFSQIVQKINISSLPAGIYFVRIGNLKGSFIKI